jgi:hypothetical protein
VEGRAVRLKGTSEHAVRVSVAVSEQIDCQSVLNGEATVVGSKNCRASTLLSERSDAIGSRGQAIATARYRLLNTLRPILASRCAHRLGAVIPGRSAGITIFIDGRQGQGGQRPSTLCPQRPASASSSRQPSMQRGALWRDKLPPRRCEAVASKEDSLCIISLGLSRGVVLGCCSMSW